MEVHVLTEKPEVHGILWSKRCENRKCIKTLENVLSKNGFVLLTSGIGVVLEPYQQKYYVSTTEPGVFIVITNLVYQYYVEAVRIRGNAGSLLAQLAEDLQKAQEEIDADRAKRRPSTTSENAQDCDCRGLGFITTRDGQRFLGKPMILESD
ncbi:MAG: hypothetical protein Q8R55_05840 [Candidatus Taylorbacteria bacterium]|nr:hypothetical protein [Candidatus Taylorbacteria bacterium]